MIEDVGHLCSAVTLYVPGFRNGDEGLGRCLPVPRARLANLIREVTVLNMALPSFTHRTSPSSLYGTMADERTPIASEHLKQVLDRLDEVLAEAARLRKEVVRQLTEQRANQQQHVTTRKRKRATQKR
jgi:hypothetical protein